jgi:uncharacterized membrane protein YhaH (DUF805 family)
MHGSTAEGKQMSKPVFEDLLAFSGHRNRKSYLLYLLAVTIVLPVMWGIAGVATYGAGWSALAIAGLVTVPIVVSGWEVGAQRCHNFGWTGWAMLLNLIPYIGWIFSLAILFIPGNQQPNRYGPDPIGTTVPL